MRKLLPVFFAPFASTTAFAQQQEWIKTESSRFLSGYAHHNQTIPVSDGNLIWIENSEDSLAQQQPLTPDVFDLSIRKLTPSGNLVWEMPPVPNATFYSATADAAGNTYVCGSYTDSLRIGSHSISSTSPVNYSYNKPTSIFFAKFSPAGQCLWLKSYNRTTAPASYKDHLPAPPHLLTSDSDGNIFISGHISEEKFEIETHTIDATTNPESVNQYVAKLNSNGQLQWIKEFKSNDHSYLLGLKTDPAGNVYVLNNFTREVILDSLGLPGSSSHHGQTRLFKFNSAGQVLWHKELTGISKRATFDVDNNGDILFAGSFQRTISLDNFNFTSQKRVIFHRPGGINTETFSSDILIAKLSGANGNAIWTKQAGYKQDEQSTAITTDSDGNVYVSAIFTDTTKFGSATAVAPDSSAIAIAKYNANGNFEWLQSAGGTAAIVGGGVYSMAHASSGHLYINGALNKNAKWENQPIAETTSERNIFLAKLEAPLNPVVLNPGANLELNCYPNPAQGTLTLDIELPEPAQVTVTLINRMGQKIMKYKIPAEGTFIKQELHVQQIPPGMYFLQLESEKEITSQKLMLQ